MTYLGLKLTAIDLLLAFWLQMRDSFFVSQVEVSIVVLSFLSVSIVMNVGD